jgi:hypothetical protein
VDEVTIPGREDANDLFKRFVSHYGAPAYMRRARHVQDAHDQLVERCRRQREEMLYMVRTRLGMLHARAGGWNQLRICVADEGQLDLLKEMFDALKPQLRAPPGPTRSERALRAELRELGESIERFNRRWEAFLASIDLAPLNALRDSYNRYYVLEKECAIRSPRLARQGFQRLEPLTLAELARQFPPLVSPRVRGDG